MIYPNDSFQTVAHAAFLTTTPFAVAPIMFLGQRFEDGTSKQA